LLIAEDSSSTNRKRRNYHEKNLKDFTCYLLVIEMVRT
jgi:hypothetical protein